MSSGDQIENNFPNAVLELTDQKLRVFDLNAKTNIPKFEYLISQFYFLSEKTSFHYSTVKNIKETFIHERAEAFLLKYFLIEKQVTSGVMNSQCTILLGMRNIDPDLHGFTIVRESVVLCFPSGGIMMSFEKLFTKRFVEVIKREKDLLKMLRFSKNYISKVRFFTPYILNGIKDPPNNIGISYIHLNKNGFILNKKKVSLIIYENNLEL